MSIIARNMKEVQDISLPIYVSTDLDELFDAPTKGTRTTENVITIDLLEVRQTSKRLETTSVRFHKGSINLADFMTETCGGKTR